MALAAVVSAGPDPLSGRWLAGWTSTVDSGLGSMWVAELADAPDIDTWAGILRAAVNDGEEYPAWRAGQEAIARWGGRMLVPDPRPVGSA